MVLKNTEKEDRGFLKVSITIMVLAISVVNMQYKLPTIIPQVMAAGELDLPTVSVLMSIFTFAGIVFAIPVGALVQRIGPKRTMMAAALLAALSCLGIFADSVPMLILTRLLEGIGLVMVLVAGPVMIQRQIAPARRGTATGIWSLGGTLGVAIASVMTPILYGIGGLYAVWVGYGSFCLLCAGLLLFLIRDEKMAGNDAVDGADTNMAAPASYKAIISRVTAPFLLAYMIFHLILLATASFAPTFLQQQGFGATLAGFISTLPMLMSIVTSIVVGTIADRTQRYRMLYIMGYLAMIVGFALIFSGMFVFLWLGLAVMGLFATGNLGLGVAIFPRLLQDSRIISMGMGVLIVVQSTGQFLGTTVPPVFLGSDMAQWLPMILSVVVLGSLGFACLIASRFK
jgi:MFS family permease